MTESRTSDTTQLLRAWAGGDNQALHELTPRVYRELRRVAAKLLQNERTGVSLQSAELVNEVYVRLIDIGKMDWQHRAHFFAMSATLMRRILLDRARKRLASKRGGKQVALNLDAHLEVRSDRNREIVALDDALSTLARVDPRKARIVELRFFGGLNMDEIAAMVNVSVGTVLRDWKMARAWLLTELGESHFREKQ
jgi:RNA polymerase sigma factor (TIGR02999 family)